MDLGEFKTRREKILQITRHRIEAKETRCMLFRKCAITDKPLFLKKCYVLTRTIYGPGTPVYLHWWIDSKQYLMLELSGRLNSDTYDFWGTAN